ncbi:tRNA (adenosine(37)-N6)-threonylcarbamoyltransferase complex transferase subunit TsaD [Bernardetia sp.]|uniref:tRNA (adenosine(37)-N6)-threonylcarbamoyltransferase complex transferase subunit TsaD n=1 Tax=Bernardetia sp. TaxID=1937974 RepID=UPI0025C1C71A|nr:tRNA (adenosine(37)-N6)-threonylcarbamoyltransferase complex transferase subunit TsaD [Bernardetia sp.]
MTKILAIESSCDETSAAVIINGEVKSNLIATQAIHRAYGGVVPELASRAHQQNIVPVVMEALKEAGISQKELDAIAFTRGPGLLGALIVGTAFAKSLALSLEIPLIEVNHMQAHVLAHFIDEPKPKFPFLCLTVSGGHTQIVLVKDHLEMEVIGTTQDDAVGEAFDKTAKILGLPYPGGVEIDKLAQKGTVKDYGLPKVDLPNLDFSFSGLKTAILYYIRKQEQKNPNFIKENINDICATIQHTLIETLLRKIIQAAQQEGINQIAIAGGVSANSELRKRMTELGKEKNWDIFIPKMEYCTDNAAMIAMAAHYKFLKGEFTDQTVAPLARMSL